MSYFISLLGKLACKWSKRPRFQVDFISFMTANRIVQPEKNKILKYYFSIHEPIVGNLGTIQLQFSRGWGCSHCKAFTLKRGGGSKSIWMMISEMRQCCQWLETRSDSQHRLPSSLLWSQEKWIKHIKVNVALRHCLCRYFGSDAAAFNHSVATYPLSIRQIW